jgi:HprK-related kinase A
VKISDLGLSGLKESMGGDGGLNFEAGPFIIRIRGYMESMAEALVFFYGEYPVVIDADFADFRLSLERPPLLRRWWRPQVYIKLDGLPVFEPYPLDHALPYYEWALNFFIARRAHQYLMLHAAVLEKYGRAFILPAYPGSGKSTLCAALMLRGWRLLSDEFGFVRPADVSLIPMPRPVALKNQSIEIIRRFSDAAAVGPTFPNTRKGAVAHLRPSAESVARMDEAARPYRIVFPLYRAGASLELTEVAKSYALLKLATNAFNYEIMGRTGFELAAHLVNACSCHNLTYSALDEAIARLEALIQE